MAKVETSVVINRPVEEVACFLFDSTNSPQWQSGVVEMSQTSEGPPGVGTKINEVRRFLGREMKTTTEVIEYEANKKLAFKSTSGPIPIQGSYNLEPVDGGTRVTFILEADVGGFFKLAEPIVIRIAKRQFETDYNNLKDLLEAQV